MVIPIYFCAIKCNEWNDAWDHHFGFDSVLAYQTSSKGNKSNYVYIINKRKEQMVAESERGGENQKPGAVFL